MQILLNIAIITLTVVLTEAFAWAVHRYVMHSWGWRWHRSHHEPSKGVFEVNDLFALVFGAFALAVILLAGHYEINWLYWIGIGISVYGILYFIVHDGLTHGRWPFNWLPKTGYLRRLVEAHHLHHAERSRTGGVSFGFLYAPPVRVLRAQLHAKRRARKDER
ncbi:MAG: sterol desaturase family protein [Pseudomonadota bacterium]